MFGEQRGQIATKLTAPDNAFRQCDTCAGRGFLRAGSFADRTFPRCRVCDGLGQIYLTPGPRGPVNEASC